MSEMREGTKKPFQPQRARLFILVIGRLAELLPDIAIYGALSITAFSLAFSPAVRLKNAENEHGRPGPMRFGVGKPRQARKGATVPARRMCRGKTRPSLFFPDLEPGIRDPENQRSFPSSESRVPNFEFL